MKKHIAVILILTCLVIEVASSQSDNDYKNGRDILGYNADMMRKGDVEIHSTDLLLHLVDFGVNDNFTLGGGLFLIPGYLNAVVLKAKVGFELSDHLSVAVANYTFIPVSEDDGEYFFNPIYGLATYNSDKFSLTGGVGAIMSDDDMAFTAKLGATWRIGEHWAVLNESYWGYDPTNNTYDDNFFLIAFVGRYVTNKWTFDLGMLNTVLIGGDGNGLLPLPHLAVSYRF